jgi:hypothetical protein
VKPAADAAAGRGGSREQGRGRSAQEGPGTSQASENSTPAEKANATQPAKRDSGSDRQPGPAAQPEKTPAGHDGPGASDGPQPPDGGDPPASGVPGHGKGGIAHVHAEFHGTQTDLYTDGTRWVTGDAVRDAQAKAAKKQADGQPEPRHHGIADIPQMRDLGSNTVGEKEAQSPGDTSDLPPTGEELLESDDKPLPRVERVRGMIDREFGDFSDSVVNTSVAAQEVSELPPPGAGLEACLAVPPSGPEILLRQP